jgi:hypothetical protein
VTDPRIIAQPSCFPESFGAARTTLDEKRGRAALGHIGPFSIQGGAAGILPVCGILAPTEGSTLPCGKPASAGRTRPCRTMLVHGGQRRGKASRSFGRRAGIVHPEGSAVRLPQESKRGGGQNSTAVQCCTRRIGYAPQRCLPEGGAAGILPVRGILAPTEGSTLPCGKLASAGRTRPCRTTLVHGGNHRGKASRSFGRRAGIVHSESSAVRLPQENTRWDAGRVEAPARRTTPGGPR